MLGPLEAFLQQFPVLLPLMPFFVLLLRVTIVLAAAFLALQLGTVLIIKLFSGKNSGLKLDTRKAKTLEALLKNVLRYAIYFFVAITVIEALGVPTASIIAGAGIVRLAVGFGAQNLVRDVLSGFFILFEDQFAVGDYIEAVGVAGEEDPERVRSPCGSGASNAKSGGASSSRLTARASTRPIRAP